jgi:lipopolysaccharide biosynthesis glycosyltransferase
VNDRPPDAPRREGLLIGLDDKFVPAAGALFASIGRHGCLPPGFPVVAVARELSEASVASLDRHARAAGLDLRVHLLAGGGDYGAVNDRYVASCYRLELDRVCRGLDRVLYLDCDLLVLDDLRPVLATALGGRTVAAVGNPPPLNRMGLAVRRRLVPPGRRDAPYFNAGVLLVDVERWAGEDVGPRAREIVNAHPDLRCLDQDALNVVLVDDWAALPSEWNVPAGDIRENPGWEMITRLDPGAGAEAERWVELQGRASILHFIGYPKPWHDGYAYPEHARLYETYRSAAAAVAGGG